MNPWTMQNTNPQQTIAIASVFALSLFFVASGCGDVSVGDWQPSAKQPAKVAAPKTPQKKTVVVKRPAASTRNSSASVIRNPAGEPNSTLREVGGPETASVKKITTIIQQSLEVGPTLIVWIIDRTASAQGLVADVDRAVTEYYRSPDIRQASTGENPSLLTALVAFDDKVEFLIDPPTGEPARVIEALAALAPSTANREAPFTAISQALQKYLPLRTDQRREVVMVVVTDEAGDDGKIVDELVEPMRRSAIPLYVIGLPAPWGQINPFAINPKSIDPSTDDSVPTLGPESLLCERVDIENWNARYTTNYLVDSGFGPFALERLCRASRGQFFALRPGTGFGYRGASARTWPTGDELMFDETIRSKYAPDYIAEADYRRLLADNKACAALCDAARRAKVAIEGTPGSRFPKGAEAQMAKQLSNAQQFAARNSPPVDELYAALAKGESDRARLTSPRWQAEFDLALGRVLANKARLDGYNSMIAALKRGKTFQKADSKEWVLEPADSFETESTIKKMAEKAKLYLDRVIHDHPGTPWTKIAEEELKTPLGWTWTES